MKKQTSIIVGLAAIVILAIGGYALFHSSSKPKQTATTNTNNSSTILLTKTSTTLGQYLTTASGMPLYTYSGDTSGVSNCSASCLATWPAYQPTSSSANLPANVGTITRSDNGQMQYTYKGMPLYTFISDTNGNPTGNGVSNFTLAKPVATTTPSQSQSQNTSPSSYSSTNNW